MSRTGNGKSTGTRDKDMRGFQTVAVRDPDRTGTIDCDPTLPGLAALDTRRTNPASRAGELDAVAAVEIVSAMSLISVGR
jgi:hypothetical protein